MADNYWKGAGKWLMESPLRLTIVAVVLSELLYAVVYVAVGHTGYIGFILSGSFPLFLCYPFVAILIRNQERLKAAQQRIEEQNKELEKLNAVKDKMFSLVAHEMRSPINSLKGLLSLVDEKAIDEGKFQSFSKSLTLQLSSTSEMLDGLLVWAKSQLKGLEPKFEVVPLKPIADRVQEVLCERAQQKGIELTCQCDASLVARVDPAMFELVIRNLVANAIKFTPTGGEVAVNLQEDGDDITVEVRDTGVGMSDDKVKELFKTKAANSSAGTNSEAGFGLGLLMCRDFVRFHDGHISVDSELGQGSTFMVNLPKKAA